MPRVLLGLLLVGSAVAASPAEAQATLQYGLQRPALASPDAPESGFGSALALLGDLDGDGAPELAVGSGGADAGAGAVRVYSGRTLELLRTVAAPRPAEGERFGAHAVATPDLTGDGQPDLLVGAPGSDPGESDAGRAYLVDAATGAIHFTLASPAPAYDAGFGLGLAAVPDVSGDGVPDLAVGEPDGSLPPAPDGTSRSEVGRVHVYSGATGAYLSSYDSPMPDPDTGLYDRGGDFGTVIVGVPDLTGDGRGELLVGAPGETREGDEFGAAGGHVWLLAGGSGAVVTQFRSPQVERAAAFGEAVALVPDRTGDGVPEVLVGAPGVSTGEAFGQRDVGAVYAMNGATGVVLDRWLSPETGGENQFGLTLLPGPDLTGDGTPEVVVVERPDCCDNPADAAWVVDGRSGAPIFAAQLPYLPWSLYGALLAPDLDGDGRPELFVATENDTFDGDEVVYGFNLDAGSSETEPNDTPSQAQRVFGPSPRTIQGRADGYDDAWVDGQIEVDLGECGVACTEYDRMEDTYRVVTTAPGLDVRVDGLEEDVDLYVFEPGTLAVLGSSTAGGTAGERVSLPALPAGEYLVGVSLYGEFRDDNNVADWTPYTLTVEGALDGSVAAEAPADPAAALGPPAPNPFRDGAAVTVTLAAPGPVRLALLDVLGREVAVLLDGDLAAGTRSVAVDGSGLAAGVYVLRLQTPAGVTSRRLTRAR